MEQVLQATNLVKKYQKKEVLNHIDVTIEPGKIYGLLGRNGAGKTTLISILTAQNTHNEGQVTYGGEPVWENESVLENLCFAREISQTITGGKNTYKVRDYLKAASIYYAHWDKEYAQRLVQQFELDPKKKICKLSKGMCSMLTIILALASCAPITFLDEPVAGLDVVAREQFYDLLMEDYTRTKRTFVVSTHIIEEAANVFEQVILMDKGKILENINTEEFVGSFAFLSGKEEDVEAVSKQFTVLHTEAFGRQKGMAVRASYAQVKQAAQGYEIDVSPVSLQKAFVYLVGNEGETHA